MQIGSVGALVVLGVLGTAAGAQATVRRGAQCEAVDQLQVALGDRGYDVGGVDGKFGGRTEAAVRRFQQQQNLLADGIVGPATARSMGLPPEFSCSFVAAQALQKPVTWPQQGEFAVATNGGALRLRQAPAGSVVGVLKNGDRVTVIETADGWAKLNSGAWVSRAWLQVGRGAANGAVSQQQSVAQSAPVARLSHRETTLANAIPGQIIQLPSAQSSAQERSQASAEPKVVAALLKTGNISVSLPPAQPSVPLTVEPWGEAQIVVEETAVIQAVIDPAAVVSMSPAPVPVAVNSSASSLASVSPISPITAARLDLDPDQLNSRALLVAAASNAIALPSATAPESTPLKAVEASRVVEVEPVTTALLPREAVAIVVEPAVDEPTLAEPVIAAVSRSQLEAPLLVEEPVVLAVRSSSQFMEVTTYGDRLLIRDSPGGQVIGSIPNGLQISTIGEQDGWYELETGGWVMARWLRS